MTAVKPEDKCWYPMRVTYSREMKVKEALDALDVENFLPMQWRIVDDKKVYRKKKLVPAISNLIFIHASRQLISKLKTTRTALRPLRYITAKAVTPANKSEILVVPDRQMENFMRVASVEDERVMFLDNNDFVNRIGQRVRITEGFFAGVEGEIKRIQGNRRVMVRLEGIAAVAITFVPSSCIELTE